MSMQSLLASNNDGFYAGMDKALRMAIHELHRVSAEMLRELRELPDLKRGVKSQQYPMLGAAWPYIRSRHWHYRKQKQRDYDKHSILDSKGSGYWLRKGSFLDIASIDNDRYHIRAEYVRRPAESQQEKRTAKRVNNKRRRAEDKREIAREMDLWAQDNEYKIDTEECWTFSVARGNTNLLAHDSGACNVYVPPHPKCFADQRVYGNVPTRVKPEFNPGNFDDYDFFYKD